MEKKSGGSALKALKTKLKSIGAIGKLPPKKQFKSLKTGPKTSFKQALRKLDSSVNPFELQFTRQKHSVVNRKVKGVAGKPLAKRKIAEETRSKTIAVALKNKGKISSFSDKRLSEDGNLSIQDKMLQRFMRERTRSTKNSLFNLEEEDLTHLGKSISLMDDFTEAGFDKVEDQDDGAIDKLMVKNYHFGGFSDSPVEKSRHEVMKEIIAKSKFHKFERQKESQEVANMADEVDVDFDNVKSMLAKAKNSVAKTSLPSQADDYDAYIREIRNDQKSVPSNRTLTEGELADVEAKKLEKLERERILRMNEPASEGVRIAEGDDLGDDYVADDSRGRDVRPLEYQDGILMNDEIFVRKSKKKNIDQADEEIIDEESDEEEEEISDSADYDMQSDSENPVEEEEVYTDINHVKDTSATIATTSEVMNMTTSIPYTFEAPNNHDDLLNYVKNLSASDQYTVIHRIRVLFHVKLGGDNKSKLETLLSVLFDHIFYLSQVKPVQLDAINLVSKHLSELIVQFPECASKICIARLNSLRKAYRAFNDKTKAYLGIGDLIFLNIIGSTFSVSDYKHCVASNARSLMEEFLSPNVKTFEQGLSGFMTCKIFFQFVSVTKRYSPRVLGYLSYLINQLTISNSDLCLASLPTNCIEIDAVKILSGEVNQDAFLTNDFKFTLLLLVIKQLTEYGKIYESIPCFIEHFQPLVSSLEFISEKFPSVVISDAITVLKQLLDAAISVRKPLLLHKRKAVPIKTFLPKFQEHYSYDRRFEPNRERQKAKKLKAEYKSEFKGAVRELRKDGQFIARQKLISRAEETARYKKKMDQIKGDLANLEGAMRGIEREKKR